MKRGAAASTATARHRSPGDLRSFANSFGLIRRALWDDGESRSPRRCQCSTYSDSRSKRHVELLVYANMIFIHIFAEPSVYP